MKNMWHRTKTATQEDYTGQQSETQPGMGLTPQQIMERFTSGRPMQHIPGYYEFNGRAELKNPLRDISRYDFADKKAYYEDLALQLVEMKNQLTKGSTKSLENTLADKIAELQDKIEHPENYDNDPDNDSEMTPE